VQNGPGKTRPTIVAGVKKKNQPGGHLVAAKASELTGKAEKRGLEKGPWS